MADKSIFGSLLDTALTPIVTAAEAIDPTGIIKQIEKQVFGSKYQFESESFPEDLGAEYMGHWMTIKFFDDEYGTPTGVATSGPTTPVFSAALFMPSATGGGSTPIYTDVHEYADIKLTNVVTNNLLGVSGTNALAMMRRAINPGVQVLYRSTALRTFQFGFLFAPRSEKESQKMEKIIYYIRRNAAPVNQGLTFKTPAEAEIKFWFNGQENRHVPKLKRCVVTNIETNYSPQGEWSTFTNGYPVSCLFTFTVREMEIIDRNYIDQGY
jgi:hypothetical protein